MTPFAFQEIFSRLQQGKATREEMDHFLAALQKQPEMEDYFQALLKAHFAQPEQQTEASGVTGAPVAPEHKALDPLLAHVWEMIDQQTKNKEASLPVFKQEALPRGGRRRIRPVKWAAAAAILAAVCLSMGIYIKNRQPKSGAQLSGAAVTAKQTTPILPGRSAAVLTLSGGRQILLDSTTSQDIKNGNQLIAHSKAGRINYRTAAQGPAGTQYNTLTTEKGNRYQLILPDGTKAWLNAESSIRFPDRFPADRRTVSITGEVYFEVQHDRLRPFTVQVKGQTIRDLGTTFNINAYDDEPAIKTTLIEGIIEVNDTRLRPGWQAAIRPGGKMTIDRNADLAAVTSWKDNSFLFHQTDMGSILRQIARWYDVRIIYKGTFDQTFTGGISRQASLSEILKILSFSNKIKFDMHDRDIIVRPR